MFDSPKVSINPLVKEYLEVRSLSENICKPLNVEDYVPQPAEFVSPPKWHLAHTTWFFEEMVLTKYLKGYEVFNKDFGFLFNSYYNSVGQRTIRGQRGVITRPGVSEVYAYRKHVDNSMKELLNQDLDSIIVDLITLGLNHEQQHQELLLTDLKYTLSSNPLYPAYDRGTSLVSSKNTDQNWIRISEGLYDIGYSDNGFCFDNEQAPHKVYLNDFEILNALVTNGEYLEFIESGAYAKFQYWFDEAWHEINKDNLQHPLYWIKKSGKWFEYTLQGLVPLDLDAQLAHVSFYEASAFAAWKGFRLPTEFEWEVAADKLNWGTRWEWTNSAYLPYPGFKKSEGAVGEYNGKFMVNQMVLRGASVATSKNHSRKT
ncbi:MAG: ergothioneine biosynthesis protein EgtB, partial [Flavobacteriales bacterium]|nr:ergothioneine biosynthesis protein EgtB [Flavobacteriales bacterium]